MRCCAPAGQNPRSSFWKSRRHSAQTYKAERMAKFIEEAADIYERRGLFTYRF